MDSDKELIVKKNIEENKEFFIRYIYFLLKKDYYFSKKPEDLFKDYKANIFLSHSFQNDFTPFIWTFFDYIFDKVENNNRKVEVSYYRNKSKELFVDKRWTSINKCFNDLYFISPTSTQISYLNLILNHNPYEISEILNISESLVLKELELSKVFMIGWLVRDKNLEKSLLSFIDEKQIVEFLEYREDLDELENYSIDIDRLLSEIDFEIAGMQAINSSLGKMERLLTSKTNS
jgi:hypothetical protein